MRLAIIAAILSFALVAMAAEDCEYGIAGSLSNSRSPVRFQPRTLAISGVVRPTLESTVRLNMRLVVP